MYENRLYSADERPNGMITLNVKKWSGANRLTDQGVKVKSHPKKFQATLSSDFKEELDKRWIYTATFKNGDSITSKDIDRIRNFTGFSLGTNTVYPLVRKGCRITRDFDYTIRSAWKDGKYIENVSREELKKLLETPTVPYGLKTNEVLRKNGWIFSLIYDVKKLDLKKYLKKMLKYKNEYITLTIKEAVERYYPNDGYMAKRSLAINKWYKDLKVY